MLVLLVRHVDHQGNSTIDHRSDPGWHPGTLGEYHQLVLVHFKKIPKKVLKSNSEGPVIQPFVRKLANKCFSTENPAQAGWFRKMMKTGFKAKADNSLKLASHAEPLSFNPTPGTQ